jgi:hypothetical protein
LKSDVDEKMEMLLNGTPMNVITIFQLLKKWNGLVKKSSSYPRKEVFESLMAPYIFFYYSLNTRTSNMYWEGKLKTSNTLQESSKNKS